MPRNIPCRSSCKKRRRKCVWNGDSTVCVRCARISVDCLPALQDFSSDEDDPPRDVIPAALEHWHYQAELLENELRRVKQDLDYYRDKQRQQRTLEWKLSIENGLLKLHTAITSYEELIMFSQASLRYLSPFQGLIKASPLQFESTAADTIVYTFCRMFSRAVDQQPYKSQAPPRSIPAGKPKILAIVDDLVQTHFRHSNPKLPLLHAPTFLKHYHRLADPLSCPMTLAICVSTICTTHFIIDYSTIEQRELAEYFYRKCKAILLDIFDDPTRKLETIFAINQLLHFVTLVLLQPSETRRLVTISYLLCKDLEPVFISGQESTVYSILFQRNFLYTESFIKLLDVVIDRNPSSTPSMPLLFVEKIPDEDETTRLHIDLYNHLLRLSNHPYVTGVASFVAFPVNNVSLEAIIQGDAAIREWWDSLPADLRICDDLYAEDAYTRLKQNNSMVSAVLFAFAHSNIIRIHTCLIVPKLSSDEVSPDENKEILRLLSERAVSKVTRSCELLLNTLIEMILLPSEALASLLFEYISRSVHALISVSSCPNAEVPLSLQHTFFRCVQIIHSKIPSDNKIPPSLSPLKKYMEAKRLGDFEIYHRYPMPCVALFQDLFSTSCAHLASHLATSSQATTRSPYSNGFMNAILCADLEI